MFIFQVKQLLTVGPGVGLVLWMILSPTGSQQTPHQHHDDKKCQAQGAQNKHDIGIHEDSPSLSSRSAFFNSSSVHVTAEA